MLLESLIFDEKGEWLGRSTAVLRPMVEKVIY